ncbi:MAG: cytochrome c oxidase subunit II [Anaerolineae bacterium]|nr:cytochrome c oxidase subunit II [Anaerolineae bacterium]
MNYKRHLVIASALVVPVTVIAYFLIAISYKLPFQGSAEAVKIDVMMQAHFVLIAFLFSLVAVLMLYGLVVFRRREGDDGDGDHIHGNTTLEILWTVVPLILVIGFGIWGVNLLNELTDAEAKPNQLLVHVQGQRWSWNFSYPELGVNAPANERAMVREVDDPNDSNNIDLILPVNRPIVLEMVSIDVLHSFWVPEFRVKQDLVPGQTTYLRFTPTAVGNYKLGCAEICGGRHAYMMATVRVVSEACFDQLVVQQLPLAEADASCQYEAMPNYPDSAK